MPDRRGPAEADLEVRLPGRVPYPRAVALQEELVRRRRSGEIPDQLLLLEHPHVITVGRGGGAEHVLADAATRARLGVELFESGRGGDVTYHGPGQVVAYPILALPPGRRDLHRYLRDLEEVLILALDSLGITGERLPGLTGVWVEGRKVAAIGVRVSSGWITSHGFALNLRTDLSWYSTIVPCGIGDREVTSVERILGEKARIPDPVEFIVPAFTRVFGSIAFVAGPTLPCSVPTRRDGRFSSPAFLEEAVGRRGAVPKSDVSRADAPDTAP